LAEPVQEVLPPLAVVTSQLGAVETDVLKLEHGAVAVRRESQFGDGIGLARVVQTATSRCGRWQRSTRQVARSWSPMSITTSSPSRNSPVTSPSQRRNRSVSVQAAHRSSGVVS
jgi:hypothetical protein